ncbi:hypothetical protein BH10BAC2_BH10BAC2_02430 [soil metagenome]
MKEFLQQVWYSNTVQSYLIALGCIVAAWLVLQLFKKIIIRRLPKWASRTPHDFDEVIFTTGGKYLIPYFYLLINYSILNQHTLSDRVLRTMDVAILIVSVYFIVKFITKSLERLLQAYLKLKGEPEKRLKQWKGLLMIVKAIIWIIGLLMMIDNLGYDVTAIVAGLGLGGIAIALAAQNILGNLFSYFVIFFDKPFEAGDFIDLGAEKVNVERIGIKTSDVRSVSGEQMIIPHAEMVKRTIRNFKRLDKRRMLFAIGVVYETAADKLEVVPSLIEHATINMGLCSYKFMQYKSATQRCLNNDSVAW